MIRGERRKRSTRRRALTAVFTVVLIPILLGFAALSVDVSFMFDVTQHTQHTADAGALAGATALQDYLGEEYYDRAIVTVAKNQHSRGFRSLDDQIVEVGRWNSFDQVFIPMGDDEIEQSNAVRVTAARHRVPLFFARLMGIHTMDVSRPAVAAVQFPCGGIWGLEEVTIPGSVVTDSYVSNDGNYTPATAGDNGDLCSGGDITVSGSALIDGDAMAGIDSELTVNGGRVEITGVEANMILPSDLPDVSVDNPEVLNDNNRIGNTALGLDPFAGGLHLRIGSDDSLTLPAGRDDNPAVFYFDSMTFTSGASLVITGPTVIYLAGDFDFTGQGTVNTTRDPKDLMIISAGEVVKMSGGVSFYGSILAPNAEVELSGTAEYFGAVIGRTVKITGDFEFHVDESSPLLAGLVVKPPILVQ
ncbi:MAG: hypothetical protein IH987_11845 [Planctomycetes bacterium]|nr:hypothetical protein [Planctomycetota bacterium]